MPRHFDRRQTLAMIAAATTATLLPANAALADPVLGDIVLGDDNAPVTVIEYASFTCPHCASFHINTWPRFKAEYIDTGKVRFILREVYFDRYGLWASMVARCGGADENSSDSRPACSRNATACGKKRRPSDVNGVVFRTPRCLRYSAAPS